MRIATWPVNGVNARKHYMCHWLNDRKPHIVALQKTLAFEPQFPLEMLDSAGYLVTAYRAFPRDFGVAVLTRKELGRPRVLQLGLPGHEDAGARLLTVKVAELTLSSVYAPAGNPAVNGKTRAIEIRAAWLESLRKHVEKRLDTTRCIVLCGDFNVLDHLDLSNGEDNRQLKLLSQSGFVDLYRYLHQDKNGHTFEFDLHKPPTSRLSRVFGTHSVASSLDCACVDLNYRQPIPGHEQWKWARSAPLIVDIE